MATVSRSLSTDPRAVELAKKVDTLVKRKFAGSYEAAFKSYTRGATTGASSEHVNRLLTDANVGGWFSRGFYVSAVMDKFDTNKNGKISWSEFDGNLKELLKPKPAA